MARGSRAEKSGPPANPAPLSRSHRPARRPQNRIQAVGRTQPSVPSISRAVGGWQYLDLPCALSLVALTPHSAVCPLQCLVRRCLAIYQNWMDQNSRIPTGSYHSFDSIKSSKHTSKCTFNTFVVFKVSFFEFL